MAETGRAADSPQSELVTEIIAVRNHKGQGKTEHTIKHLTLTLLEPYIHQGQSTYSFQVHMESADRDHMLSHRKVSINFKGLKSYKVCSLSTIELEISTPPPNLEDSQIFGN